MGSNTCGKCKYYEGEDGRGHCFSRPPQSDGSEMPNLANWVRPPVYSGDCACWLFEKQVGDPGDGDKKVTAVVMPRNTGRAAYLLRDAIRHLISALLNIRTGSPECAEVRVNTAIRELESIREFYGESK